MFVHGLARMGWGVECMLGVGDNCIVRGRRDRLY